MGFEQCLTGALGKAHARKEDAAKILAMYKSRVAELERGGTDSGLAKRTALEEVSKEVAEREKWGHTERMISVRQQIKHSSEILSAPTRPGKVLRNIMADLDRTSRGYLQTLHGQVADFLEDTAGFMNIKKLQGNTDNVLRELYGTKTGDAKAKAYADAIRDMYKTVTREARALGVNMVDDPRFHAPQFHNGAMMRDQTAWVKHHLEDGVLDWDAMKHHNDGAPIAVDDRERVLNSVYDSIRTDGMNKITMDSRGGSSLDAKFTNKRFLRYATAESWLGANKAFNDTDFFEQIISYMTVASKDLGQLNTLGPNPLATKARLENAARIRAVELFKAGGEFEKAKVENDVATADEIYGTITGKYANIAHTNASMAISSINTAMVGALLGKTFLTAVPTDVASMAHTATFLAKNKGFDPVRGYGKLLNPANKADRAFAKRSFAILEHVMDGVSAAERYAGDPMGPKWLRSFSDKALRATGLNAHTFWARTATTMELMGSLADTRHISFDKLEGRDLMEQVGITAKDWDTFRSTDVATHNGSDYLRLVDFQRRTDIGGRERADVFEKFSAYQTKVQELAVPTASIEGKVFLSGLQRKGTFASAALSSVTMFKNFPISIMMHSWGTILAQKSMGDKIMAGGAFLSMMTAGGVAAEQFRHTANGEDWESFNPIENPNLYLKGMARGGGGAFVADLLLGDQTRYKGGFFANMAGPTVGFLDSTASLTLGNVQKALKGEDVNFSRDFVNYATRYTPGSGTWWAARSIQAATDHLFLSQVDPNYNQNNRAAERRRETLTGVKPWWGRGDLTPSRAPEFSSPPPK